MKKSDSHCFIQLTGTCFLAFLFLTGTAFDGPRRNKTDYTVIVDRNPFGLRPPLLPPTNHVTRVQPEADLLLTGIVSFGSERAYFMSKSRRDRAPEYYALGPGEARNGVQVIDIDPVAGKVRVRRNGVESFMTFQTDGVKPPVSVAASARNAASKAQPRLISGLPAGQSSRVRTIPNRTVRSASTSTTVAKTPPSTARPFPVEQDIIMMELQKAANPHIEFPPTPLRPR